MFSYKYNVNKHHWRLSPAGTIRTRKNLIRNPSSNEINETGQNNEIQQIQMFSLR